MAKEKLTKLPAAGTLRVWWIPQVPGKPFHVAVASPLEAKKLLIVLAKYDLFQFHHNIKGDYSNAGGLEEVSRDGRNWHDWHEWHDQEDRDISELTLKELQEPLALDDEVMMGCGVSNCDKLATHVGPLGVTRPRTDRRWIVTCADHANKDARPLAKARDGDAAGG